VLDEYCTHRRASLVFARNEECGLRCLYHGWKFDVDGNVIERASEPPGTKMPPRLKQKSYPAREAGGFVWCYMGPAGEMPEFEPPAFAPTPDVRVSATKVRVRCNWAQILEGQIDSAHSSSLHSSDMVPAQVEGAEATEQNWLRPSTDKAPRFQIERTSYGFRYAAIRRPIKNEETHDYIRTTVYIAPFTALIPPNNVHNVATLLTPEDDTNTIFYFIAWNGSDKPGIGADAWRKFNVLEWGVDVDRHFDGIRQRENLYQQDRAAMKDGNFTGIQGIPNQDIAMWESMGPISDRSKEHVGTSDVAVVAFRRLMVEAAREIAAGGPAIGTTAPHVAHATISSFEGVVPKTTNWRTLGGGSEAPQERVRQVAKAAG
jgi:phthalate 4,5-dioxygenase oxygenase subunit